MKAFLPEVKQHLEFRKTWGGGVFLVEKNTESLKHFDYDLRSSTIVT